MNDLDPNLLELFDTAPAADANDAAFLSMALTKLESTRRIRVLWRLALTAMIVVLGALLAPYAAQITLTAIDWLMQHLPATGMVLASPIGCACAALIAWRIARRRFG